jgi:hypothetical protein
VTPEKEETMSTEMNYLLETTDARKWAQEFMREFGDRKAEIDEGLMIAWFANAIETGRRIDGSSLTGAELETLARFRPRALPPWTEAEAEASRPHCVYPGCPKGPSEAGGNEPLERVNPKGEPFEGACPDHYEAVVLGREPAQ